MRLKLYTYILSVRKQRSQTYRYPWRGFCTRIPHRRAQESKREIRQKLSEMVRVYRGERATAAATHTFDILAQGEPRIHEWITIEQLVHGESVYRQVPPPTPASARSYYTVPVVYALVTSGISSSSIFSTLDDPVSTSGVPEYPLHVPNLRRVPTYLFYLLNSSVHRGKYRWDNDIEGAIVVTR